MLQKENYDPYYELALSIVSEMCADYIRNSKLIHKYDQYDELTQSQYNRYTLAKRHINEDIDFFMSDRPFKLCNIWGTYILNKLNERLKEEGIKCA